MLLACNQYAETESKKTDSDKIAKIGVNNTPFGMGGGRERKMKRKRRILQGRAEYMCLDFFLIQQYTVVSEENFP